MKRFDEDQFTDYCCSCKIRIRSGALIVTLLTLVFGVCVIYLSTNFDGGLTGLYSIVTSVFGIYAYYQRVAWAWLPITLRNACWSGIHLFGAMMSMALHVASYVDYMGLQNALEPQLDAFTPQVFQAVTAVFGVILALLAWLWAWFMLTTYRAFKWQKREDLKNVNNYVKVAV